MVSIGGLKLKKFIASLIFLFIIIPNVLAITGEIGNARVVIKKDFSGIETIERTILVRNSNDVPLDITLEATDEINEITEIIDKEFKLEAGEEKKARFNLNIKQPGEWAGKINVFFKPEEGNTVVLASNLILIIKGENGEIPIDEEDQLDDSEDELDDEDDEITGDVVSKEEDDDTGKESSIPIGIILAVVIGLVVVGAIIGLIFLLKK